MTDLLKDLEAVALLADRLDQLSDAVAAQRWNEFSMRVPAEPHRDADLVLASIARFLRTHHAEIAEAVKDAERWRALHWAEAPMVTVTGSQLARGIRPGDYAVPWDWPVISKTRIRMIVMNNSAREDGE